MKPGGWGHTWALLAGPGPACRVPPAQATRLREALPVLCFEGERKAIGGNRFCFSGKNYLLSRHTSLCCTVIPVRLPSCDTAASLLKINGTRSHLPVPSLHSNEFQLGVRRSSVPGCPSTEGGGGREVGAGTQRGPTRALQWHELFNHVTDDGNCILVTRQE